MPVRGSDAQIPLMGQSAPRIDPFASLGQILQLREMQDQREDNQRARAKEQQFEALAQQFGDDPETFVKEVSRLDPKMGATMAELYAKTRKEKFSAYGAQLDSETKQLELATRELQSIPDGDVPTAAAWRGKWVSRDPQLDQILPPPEALATPDVRQQVLGLGLSTVEFNKARADGVKAFISGDYRKGLGNTLAVAPSLEAAQATIAEAKAAVPRSAQGDVSLFEGLLAQSNGDLAAFQAAAGNAALDQKDRAAISDKATDNARADTQFQELMRHNQATEGQNAQTKAEAARHNRAMENKPTGGSGDDTGGLVDTVINNPMLWDELTPTVKGKIAGALAAKGFDGFGKPMSNAAIKQVAESKSAIDSLKDLRKVLQDNEQYIGPIAGLQALNPYSEANRAQARIDLVKQRVGKTLEGGVLRKEDEEKYKKILTTLRDVPATAISKIDGLVMTLDNDIKRFTAEQRLAGRRVNQEAKTSITGPSVGTTRTVKGVTYTWDGKGWLK